MVINNIQKQGGGRRFYLILLPPGNEIIGDLGAQRETLERTRARLIESDLELGRSRRILKKMYLNVFSNKIILIVIIIIEIAILAGVIYYKYGRK